MIMGKGKTKHVVDNLGPNESRESVDDNGSSSQIHQLSEKNKQFNKKRKSNQ